MYERVQVDEQLQKEDVFGGGSNRKQGRYDDDDVRFVCYLKSVRKSHI